MQGTQDSAASRVTGQVCRLAEVQGTAVKALGPWLQGAARKCGATASTCWGHKTSAQRDSRRQGSTSAACPWRWGPACPVHTARQVFSGSRPCPGPAHLHVSHNTALLTSEDRASMTSHAHAAVKSCCARAAPGQGCARKGRTQQAAAAPPTALCSTQCVAVPLTVH